MLSRLATRCVASEYLSEAGSVDEKDSLRAVPRGGKAQLLLRRDLAHKEEPATHRTHLLSRAGS